MSRLRMLGACSAVTLVLVLLSGCAAFPVARSFKSFATPERPAIADLPKPPDVAGGISVCGDKICLTPEAMNAIKKHIVDLEATEKMNRLREEGYRKNAEFLIGIMNNLLSGER